MFEEQGMDRDKVLESLDTLLADDATYQSGRPVASMSTIPHEIGVEVFSKTLEKNAGRLHTFKGSARVEQEVIAMIGNLLNLNYRGSIYYFFHLCQTFLPLPLRI